MAKQTKALTFLLEIYPNKSTDNKECEKSQWFLLENNSRDPLSIFQNSATTGFKFFDRFVIVEDDKIIEAGDPFNYSKTYYFGKRVTARDYDEISDDDTEAKLWAKYLDAKGLDSLILCDNGVVIDNPSDKDMTIEEVKHVVEHNLDKDVVIEHGKFFKGLAAALELFEDDIAYMISEKIFCPAEEDTENEQVVRSYSISNGEDLIINYPTFLDTDVIGSIEPKAENEFTFADALDVTKVLYNEYPYLIPIMDKVRVEMHANENCDIENAMIDVAMEYANYGGKKFHQSMVYLKKKDN